MTDLKEIDATTGARIRSAVSEFFVPLQTVRVVNKDRFEDLVGVVKVLAKQWKDHEVVPKSLLSEVYLSALLLRNEASDSRDYKLLLEDMANQLESLFGAILLGESDEDRVPGVPRIM